MESLRQLAARLDDAAATLSSVAYAVTATDPAPSTFGADAAGRPGEIGRALHRTWQTAISSRAHEAITAAARIEAVAEAIRTAAQGYADSDLAARWRQSWEA